MSRRNRFCSIAAMATFDAVFVGSGINSLVGAALLAREGWSVCVLERNDVAGGCIRTSTDLTLPGFTHEVLASWHPLFTGSAAYAELEGRADRPRGHVRQHGPADRNARSPTARRRSSRARSRATWRSSTGSLPATAPPGSGSSTSSWATPTSRSGSSSTELWSTAGLTLGRKALRRLGRRGLLEFAGKTLVSCRDWVTDDVRVRGGARRSRALGAAHGPRARSGDVRVHDAGDRCGAAARRNAGAGRRRRPPRRRARRGSSPTRAARCGSRPMCERILVANGRATGVRLTDGEVVAATRAVVANVTPTQLYGSLLGGSDVPDGRRRGGRAVPLRPRRDADPPRARRAAALEGRRGRAPRPLPDRPRHARPRRRLARGQRGRARAAAGRGHDRLRPAGRARSLARARRQVDPLDPAAGASRRPRSRATPQARSTPATARWTDDARARRTPTGSWPRLGDSIENLGAATLKRVVALARRHRGAQPRTSSAATSTAARARSTRTCSGARWPRLPATRRPWPGLWHIGASTHPGPGLGAGSGYLVAQGADEAAAARSGCSRSCRGAREPLAVRDLDGRRVVRRGRRGVRRRRLRRDRDLGVQAAAATTRRTCALLARARPARRGLRARGPVGAPARDPRDGGPVGRRGAHRGARGIGAAVRRLRARVRRLPRRPARRPHERGGHGPARRRACSASAPSPATAGVRVGFEPVHRTQRDEAGFVNSLADADAVLASAGAPQVGILFDTYHVWDDPEVLPTGSRRTSAASSASTSATGRRSTAPTACFPGEGISRTLELVAALVLRGLGRRPRRRDLLDARALLGPPGRRGSPPRLRRAPLPLD